MKSKVAQILITLLLSSLVFSGLISCVPYSPQMPDNSAVQSNPEAAPQAQAEDAGEDEIVAVAIELKTKSNDLDGLLLIPEINNDEWISKVTLALADITDLCEQAYEVVPLDSMTDEQAVFLEAVNNIDDSVDLLLKGIEGKNVALIDQASAEIWLANEVLTQIVESLE